VGKMMESFLLS